MAEHVPHIAADPTVTMTASATVTAGQLLEVTGNMTCGPAGALSTKTCGVAGNDAANGALVTVYAAGVHDLTASGAISAGDLVVAAATGKVQTIGANVFGTVVGRALEAIADTAKGRVRLGAL